MDRPGRVTVYEYASSRCRIYQQYLVFVFAVGSLCDGRKKKGGVPMAGRVDPEGCLES